VGGGVAWLKGEAVLDTTVLMGGSGIIGPVIGEIVDERQLAEQLLAQAKAQGVGLVVGDG
jgi:hypothetical protein